MGKKKYPTRKQTNFVLAEDIRPELNQKATITGVYVGNYVRLHKKPTKKKPVTLRLVMLFGFRDGAGDFDVKVRIAQPDGRELAKFELGKVVKTEKSSMPIAVGVLAAKINQLGTYKAIALLDDRGYEFEFDIDIAPSKPKEAA
jgi:hypothetical protein